MNDSGTKFADSSAGAKYYAIIEKGLKFFLNFFKKCFWLKIFSIRTSNAIYLTYFSNWTLILLSSWQYKNVWLNNLFPNNKPSLATYYVILLTNCLIVLFTFNPKLIFRCYNPPPGIRLNFLSTNIILSVKLILYVGYLINRLVHPYRWTLKWSYIQDVNEPPVEFCIKPKLICHEMWV